MIGKRNLKTNLHTVVERICNLKSVEMQSKPDGRFQDKDGRWRTSNWRFAPAPENILSQKTTVKSKEVTKSRSGEKTASSRRTNPDGSFYDINGRLHSKTGQFVSMKSEVSVDPKDSTKSLTNSKTVTPTRKTNPDGSFYDVKGRLHSADGKFIKMENSLSVKPKNSLVPKDTVPVAPRSATSTPVGNSPITKTRVSSENPKESVSASQSSASNRVVNSDGSFYDVNGRLHAADGKFISTKNIIGS
ncbi:hypothetical protein FO519_010452, partial [Halicephalobus sp. NKZ332]